MSIIKNIALIVVVTFFVCGHVEIIAAQKFSVEQWLGRWYEIGKITPPYADPYPVDCGRYDITRKYKSKNGFIEKYSFMVEKIPIYYDGYGEITNSEMNVTIPALRQMNFIYTITTFNGDTEIITNKKDEKKYYGLLSRVFAISEPTRQMFERIAAAVGVHPFYIPHSNCTYD